MCLKEAKLRPSHRGKNRVAFSTGISLVGYNVAWRLSFLCISFVCLFDGREGVFIIGKTQFVRREARKYAEYAYLRKLHVKRAMQLCNFCRKFISRLKNNFRFGCKYNI